MQRKKESNVPHNARARVAVEFLLEPAGAKKKKNTEKRKQKGQIHRNTHEASKKKRPDSSQPAPCNAKKNVPHKGFSCHKYRLQQWPTARAFVAVDFLLEPAGAKKKNTENRKQKRPNSSSHTRSEQHATQKLRYSAHAHKQGNTCWFTCGPHVVAQVCTREPCACFPIQHDMEK